MSAPRPDRLDRTHGHINRDTGGAGLHREYTGRLIITGDEVGTHAREEFTFTFSAAVEIMQELTTEDTEKIGVLVGDLYVGMIANSLVLGLHPSIALAEAERTYVDNLYRMYVIKMKRKGTFTGKLAWLVDPAMQDVVYEEN